MEEPELDENFSVLHNIVHFNYMARYLVKMLNIAETIVVGEK